MDKVTHKIMAIISVANKGVAADSMGNELCAVAACLTHDCCTDLV